VTSTLPQTAASPAPGLFSTRLGIAPRTQRAVGLTRARTAAGLAVTQLARRLQVSRTTVSMWESGARAAARSHWPALGRALGLGPDQVADLFVGSPPARYDARRLPSLALARRRAALTQRELAARLGVAPTTVSMWESAGVPVPTHLLDRLAQLVATDLHPLELLPRASEADTDPRPLRHFRRAAGMSQREAAAYLRIAVGTLARYEAGERATPVAVVRRMAAAYSRSVGEVLRCSGTAVVPVPSRPWSTQDLPAAPTALRSAAGMTKEELGRTVGMSGQAVRAWEAGHRRPTPLTCRRLEVVFRLPAGKLPY
jgi:transcriptional regulator with XRE-family HTH domain